MTYTMKEVLRFVEENDIKFIRLAFCDLFGKQKNISIMPSELERAFTNGISFDASAIAGFGNVEESDLFLVPDPNTLNVLPWRPQQGRVARFYCDIIKPNGEPFASDTRNILKSAIKRAEDLGFFIQIGAECEFYLFKNNENGEPILVTLDEGGYFDVAPLDKGENVRREICLCLEDMGIKPETSHHEQGPGQNEVDFKYSDPLTSADNFLTFKSVVKAIAQRNGLFASFLPKPLNDKSGSGLHINISINQNGKNLFGDKTTNITDSFIEGVLKKTQEIAAFTNPIENSYLRLGSYEAPRYISWSQSNRSQLVRIPAASEKYSRMELRSPDPTVNPYIVYALIIHAGLDGVEHSIKLRQPINENLFLADKKITATLEALPSTLSDALECAKQSEFVSNILGTSLIEKYISYKKQEIDKKYSFDWYFKSN